MIFPIADDNSDRTTTPVVNYVLIAINILVFVFLQQLGTNDQFTYAFSTVPAEILTGQDVASPVRIRDPLTGDTAGVIEHQPTPFSVYLTLLTSMFMHGGLAHIFGNMLYLWIFGDNLEHTLGRTRYLAFYLLCGLLASLAHVFTSSGGSSFIPSLGASGAISGVLGGYLVLHPKRRVRVIMLNMLTEVPAVLAIGLWFAFQLINGLGMLGGGSREGGGVAYAAHIGGFIAGVVLIKVFAARRRQPAAPRF